MLEKYIEMFDDLLVVDEPVSRVVDVSRILKANEGVPILFNDLDGYRAVGNVWATRERIARGLGIDRKDLLRVLLNAMERPEECVVEENPEFMDNILTDFDLTESPIPKYFPGDGGHYITSGVISAEFGGKRNLSFHRMMVLDSGRLAVRLVPRHLYSMYNQAIEAGEDLRIAISIGLPPELLLSAAMSVSYDTDESRIASAISFIARGERVKLARLNSGLYVPAESEYVFEGRLTPELVDEGPFVDITGTYDEVRKQPVIEIDTIYHVNDPIFHLLLPGGNEHFLLMGLPREPVIFRSVQNVLPSVHDVRLTEGGCSWLNGVVSITPQRKGDAKNAILAAFSGHPSMKRVVVVDDDIDIHNDREVEWAVATRSQPDTDILVVSGARGSSLDPSLKPDGTTAKIGIDATIPPDRNRSLFTRASLDEE